MSDEFKRCVSTHYSSLITHHSSSTLPLSVLNNDAFNYVGDVFATIDRGFQFLVNLFPLQHRERIVLFVKELCDRGLIDVVLIREHSLKLASRVANIERHLHEEIKILFFFRQEIE